MAHEKKSVRRKIASQVSSAQGGQTSRPKRAASAGPKSAVYKMTKAYSDAVKKQNTMFKRRDAADKQLGVVSKKVETLERRLKSARR